MWQYSSTSHLNSLAINCCSGNSWPWIWTSASKALSMGFFTGLFRTGGIWMNLSCISIGWQKGCTNSDSDEISWSSCADIFWVDRKYLIINIRAASVITTISEALVVQMPPAWTIFRCWFWEWVASQTKSLSIAAPLFTTCDKYCLHDMPACNSQSLQTSAI